MGPFLRRPPARRREGDIYEARRGSINKMVEEAHHPASSSSDYLELPGVASHPSELIHIRQLKSIGEQIIKCTKLTCVILTLACLVTVFLMMVVKVFEH